MILLLRAANLLRTYAFVSSHESFAAFAFSVTLLHFQTYTLLAFFIMLHSSHFTYAFYVTIFFHITKVIKAYFIALFHQVTFHFAYFSHVSFIYTQLQFNFFLSLSSLGYLTGSNNIATTNFGVWSASATQLHWTDYHTPL